MKKETKQDLKQIEMERNENMLEHLIRNEYVKEVDYIKIFREQKFSEKFIKKWEEAIRKVDEEEYYGDIFQTIGQTQELSNDYIYELYKKEYVRPCDIAGQRSLDIKLFNTIFEDLKENGYGEEHWALTVALNTPNEDLKNYIKEHYKKELWDSVLGEEWLYEQDDGGRFLNELYLLKSISL